MNNCIATIIGRKGCGKTTLAKELLKKTHKAIIVVDTIREYTIGVEISVSDLKRYKEKQRFIVRISPDTEADFDTVLHFAYQKGNCQVLIDEAGYWQTPYYCPEGLDTLLRYGRHRSVDLIQVVRRPAELHRLSTAMTDIFFIFKTTEPNDLDYLGRIDGRLPEIVKRLDRYEYVVVDFQDDFLRKGITLDNLRTYRIVKS